MTCNYTSEQAAWIEERYPSMPTPMMARLFEERFGRKTTPAAISQHAWRKGISKEARPSSRQLLPERAVRKVRWGTEPEKQEWMEAHCTADARGADVSAAFEAEFGFPLSRPQITLWRQANGRATRRRGDTGYAATKVRPVGSEYVGRGGSIMVKVAERPSVPGSKDNWRQKHVWAWERDNGPVPEGYCVWAADGDKGNIDPENLVLVPRRVYVQIEVRSVAT